MAMRQQSYNISANRQNFFQKIAWEIAPNWGKWLIIGRLKWLSGGRDGMRAGIYKIYKSYKFYKSYKAYKWWRAGGWMEKCVKRG